MTRKLLVLNDCVRECPHIRKEHTPGSGFGEDYYCTNLKRKRKICGYIEWDSELPKFGTFPDWCPLYEAEEGMYE